MRIVTYNTRGSLGMDGSRSTRRIAEVVRALTPDVVCFQEIHRRLPWSGREDQPALLSTLLGRRFVFQSNASFGLGGYGLGIATRGQIAGHAEHLLPSLKEQRGALEVRLREIGGLRALTVFCTHWGLQAEERLQQAEALAQIINAAPHPIVVCGDLNEPAEEPAVQRLLALTGLLDADAAQNRVTFVSDNPTTRIDYIFHSPDLATTNVEIVPSQASDHLPLLADLEHT